jgi:molybdenum cofactor cytidylyltransferase
VDELLRCPTQQPLVVTGRDGEAIREALEGRDVAFVENPDHLGDMLSSIRCGLRVLPAGCTAFLLVLGDQPNLTTQLVTELIGAFSVTNPGIVVPAHNGHRGHPVLLAAHFRDELLTSHESIGLLGLLEMHANEMQRVEVPDGVLLDDMDTPADYEQQLNVRERRAGIVNK